MSNKNDQLVRMKELIDYGKVNENTKPIVSYNIEHKAVAADGKCYGIIRENSKYFVKVATPGKETVAESYQYIGGILNKKNYEYNSYANALKQFELKLGSINEAYDEDRKVNVETLDPYKKEDLVVENTEKFGNELARQRQIMRNASVIMNEATEIGSTPFKTQPEAEHDNSGDKDYPFTKEGKAEEDRGAIKFGEGSPEKHSATFGPDSNDVEDYNLDKGKTPKVDNSVASEHPSGGKVARVNESMEECGAACGMKECGTAGMMPEEGDDEIDLGVGDAPAEPAAPALDEPIDGGMEGEGEPVPAEPEVGPEEPMGEPGDDSDLDARISELESELAALKAQRDGDDLGGDEEGLGDDEDLDLDLDDDEDFDLDDDDEDLDLDDDDDLDIDDEEELGDDEEGFDDGKEELGDEEDIDDPEVELDENVVKKFRQLVRESIDEMFAERKQEAVNEAKASKMNSIVESVVKDILAEDELHVFGDHPGYRKKPMDLPPTGSDKFQDNRDWNDDSVHSEEPFGKGKGDSTPFDQLVAQITDSVMKQISEGKKKVK